MENENLFFTKEHLWIKFINEKTIICGITDFAQKELGEIIYFEFVELSEKIKKGDKLCEVESMKSITSIYSPFSGNIIEKNNNLLKTPELLNQSCYEDGWIIKIEITDLEEKKFLLTKEEYQNLIAE
ncbi:MAG TPA: glycine cleavage system protein GcvH [bacterium]|nr:glycine cleavage system protein GcvH [bacterium]HOL48012.1 glycine cleavage system protein GcvH [bacterium]HPQ19314.1 glycine cleavage system protein GcvH [bacterium]